MRSLPTFANFVTRVHLPVFSFDAPTKSVIRKLLGWLLLGIIYYLVSAASFNGFYDKWGFREDKTEYSFDMMLSGDAKRPFVYRRLNPYIVKAVSSLVTDAQASFLQSISADPYGKNRIGPDFLLRTDARYFLDYQILYYLTFGELLAGMFVLRLVCLEVTSGIAATLAPLLFALSVPVLMTRGGYFYDISEILFLALATLAALRGRIYTLVFIAALGALNKESFFFFLPALLPLLLQLHGWRKACLTTLSSMVVALAVYALVRYIYRDNPGSPVEMYFIDNIIFYSNPLKLLRLEKTYGLFLPQAYSIVSVFVFVYISIVSWRRMTDPWRRYLVVIAAINSLLFIVFAFPGEIRNLSLCSVVLCVMIAHAIDHNILVSGSSRDDLYDKSLPVECNQRL